MFWRRNVLVGVIFVGSLASSGHAYDFGRTATPEEIKLWDIDVRPDGKGLPDGSGTAAHGKAVYEQNCEACRGPNGQWAGLATAWLAGEGAASSELPTGPSRPCSYWPPCDDSVRLIYPSGQRPTRSRARQHRFY
jgi:cytochrome c